MANIDAVLLIALGGPERIDDVRPFIAELLRGRPVPPARMDAVVHHYELIGGRSPLNDLTFQQAAALRALLEREGPALPVYVGMRAWRPALADTLERMTGDGVRRALAFILSAQRSEASWGRYEAAVTAACGRIGANAPQIEYPETWHAHPLFVEAHADRLQAALSAIPEERRAKAAVVFTAHSIPTAMAAESPYVAQFREGAERIARRTGAPPHVLAYQSRSGNPRDPWLEPDVLDALRTLAGSGVRDVVLAPIGFVCDHVEVLYDLDIEARELAVSLGMNVVRAGTLNDHPAFIRMIAEVVRRHAGNC